MLRSRLTLLFGLSLLLLGTWSAAAQAQDAQADEELKARINKLLRQAEEEYRLYFREPKNVAEHWAVFSFEIDVGKFDMAAFFLNRLLNLPKTSKITEKELLEQLLDIEETKGLNAFLRLRTIRKWDDNPSLQKLAQENVEKLIQMITQGLEQRLADPTRIGRYIRQLQSLIPEERAFAFDQINRSRQRATPYLVDALRATAGKLEHERLKQMILKMDPEVLPPMLEILKAVDDKDAADPDLRLAVLDLFRARGDESIVPYLWHLSASPRYHGLVRKRAKEMLIEFLKIDEENLPSPLVVLTQQAERYYQHQVRFSGSAQKPGSDIIAVKVWPWNGRQLARKPQELPADMAEIYFGLRYAREALELDPAYKPAQIVFLGLLLERAFTRGLDQFLFAPLPPDLHNLLSTIDSDLLLDSLSRAVRERNVPVILPLVRTLGERGEVKAAQPVTEGPALGVLRTLYYPDRRVQFETVRAVVQMPGPKSTVIPPRVVELLARFLLLSPQAKAMFIHVPEPQTAAMRQAVKAAGFEPVITNTNKGIFEALHRSADFDVILIHPSYPLLELSYLLAELRADTDVGLLPVVLLGAQKDVPLLKKFAGRYSNVFVALDAYTHAPAELKGAIEDAIQMSMAPSFARDLPGRTQRRLAEELRANKSLKLSEEERKNMPGEALDILWNMALGNIRGYNVAPAKDALLTAIQSPDEAAAEKALHTLAKINTAEVQQRLADYALNENNKAKLRLAAAADLNEHIKKNGLALTTPQVKTLQIAFGSPKLDQELRSQLALIIGQFSATPRQTGLQLRNFTPAPPPPPPAPPKQAPPAPVPQ